MRNTGRPPTLAPSAMDGRLVLVPSRLRELGFVLGASTLIPLWIAALPLLVVLLLAALTESGVIWAVFWVGLGLMVLAVLGLALALTVRLSITMVRWIEFRPQGHAVALVIMGFLRPSTIAASDLQRIVVLERLQAGRRKSITLVLHTSAGTVHCEPARTSPLRTLSTQTLIDLLARQLGPAGAPVEYRSKADRSFPCPDEWWSDSQLAALWRVPAGTVDEVAAHHGVRRYQYTPRTSAAYSAHTTVTVYDPARALEVAAELRENADNAS